LAKVAGHGRYVVFEMVEVAIYRDGAAGRVQDSSPPRLTVRVEGEDVLDDE
jgi:hypothetical protein